MTGILPSKIFVYGKEPPSFLNGNIVNQWQSVEGYKARYEDVKWVLQTCTSILAKLSHSLSENKTR